MLPAALILLAVAAPLCLGQPFEPEGHRPLSAAEVGERRDSLLADLSLVRPLAASLRNAITSLAPQSIERKTAAERLGALYAKMLETAATTDEKKSIELLAQELLDAVPEAATPKLRLSLLTAQYLPTEDVVERRGLRLSNAAEEAEAERVLRATIPQFERVAIEVQSRVRLLEERNERGSLSDAEMERVRAELKLFREMRAEASFRAGWANYYLGVLSATPQLADRALKHFGVLLNAAPGSPATIDRLPASLLSFDAVAKATLGCALSCTLAGNHIGAQRWLSELQAASELPDAVKAQLPRRAFAIYAASDSWSNIELLVSRMRNINGAILPLPVADARTLAVLSLEASRNPEMGAGNRERAQATAAVALGDLVTRGEVPQVVGLVKLYGTSIIGTDGFINNYVRALCAYDDARAQHGRLLPAATHLPVAATGKAATDPPAQELKSLIDAYIFAADLCASSLLAADASSHPQQRTKAQLCIGYAHFFAGQLPSAASAFEAAFAGASSPTDRQEALYRSIHALTLAIDAAPPASVTAKPLAEQRERLSILFIQLFPHTREANQLLYARMRSSKALTPQDIEALLQVPASDPIYLSVRRNAADALYKLWQRGGTGGQRDAAALRFAEVAAELLAREFELATGTTAQDDPQRARSSATVAILQARRTAEALMSCESPDAARAETVVALIESLVAFHSLDMSSFQDELWLRRYQIAAAKGDAPGAQRALQQLRSVGGPYLRAADQHAYTAAVRALATQPTHIENARDVISTGTRMLTYVDLGSQRLASIRNQVAAAATVLFTSTGQQEFRALALKLDAELEAAGLPTLASLQRVAQLREAGREPQLAAKAWLDILAQHGEGTRPWYEARYESIRLIAEFDAPAALQSLAQFKSLHPTLGGPPWDEKFSMLQRKLDIQPTPSTTRGQP